MADQLNDGCWKAILKQIDLKDQLVLSQVSERIHTSIQKYWTRIVKLRLNNDILKYFEQNPHQMQDFFKFASTLLRELSLEFEYFDAPQNTIVLIQLWKSNPFPNLRTLNCKFMEPDVMAVDQLILLQLTQTFPRLTHVSVSKKVVGEFFWHWRHLKNVTLINCESIDPVVFHTEFQVEKISLIYYQMPFFCNQNALSVVRKLANFHTFKARTLIFNFWAETEFEELPIEIFTDLHYICLNDIFVQWQQRHLDSQPYDASLKTNKIWDIVAACNNLQHFYLSHVKLDVQFLRESSACLESVLSKRTAGTPLTLHLFKTGLELNQGETVELLDHPNLKFSFDQWDRNGLLNLPSIFIDYLSNPEN